MGKKLISGLLVLVLTVSMVFTASATDMQDAKDKQQQLEEQRKEAAAEKASLSAKVKALTASMQEAQSNLDKKRSEIETTEQELIMSKLYENEQRESMRLRIKYMYENGNVNYMELFLESESIADFFTRTEYISKLSEYDRKKLEEFQMTVRLVEEKELALEAEYKQLEELQLSLAAQKSEVEILLKEKSAELSGIQAELNEVKAQIQKAEEEERRRQEAEEAKKQENTSPESSSNETPSAPVVSGSGYFTHPCPGMSYQSSYFGEVRYGIGDTRPHKGHDYAASKGTPIYAAAAGAVLIAGYSSSAGYWVVIDHGNGLTSKYMHMYQRPLVYAGQSVAKGQHIGGVGTTGQSTGNHLHFQVEEYGVAVNPSKYM